MPRFNPSERGDLGPSPEVKPVYVPSNEERIAAKATKQATEKPVAPKKVISKEELSKKLKKRAARKKVPTVRRGESGRIESTRTPVIPQTEEKTREIVTRKTIARVSKPRTKQTRTGKKLDRTTGKIAVPLVKRGEGGRVVGTTPEERKAAITTILPEAGRELMQPAARGITQQAPGTLARGGQRNLRGFGVPHARVKSAVDAAMHHLGNMVETKGTPEFDQHEKTFDAIHANIQNMDRHGLGITVGQLKHQSLNGKSPHVLRQLHTMIQDRLEEGRMAEEENKQRIQEGRARKAAQQ